ncbi:MAG: class I tRNA ligase family protein, partial [Oscillospiraceae bacterium]|nr:class I tRNA ligase family protein [Oscillospiraceae bacterium]
LHCGGEDLIFPHHENEIAQSECANGCEFSHYWMHNAFLNVDNQKMSKSLNNFFTVREIAEQIGYEVIRYFLLTAHYRSPLNFTREIMGQCKSSLERLYTAREHLDFLTSHAGEGEDTIVAEADRLVGEFVAVMDDDLNTADALSKLFELVTFINVNGKEQSKAALEHAAKIFDEMAEVLGILYNRNKDEIPAEVKALVEERTAVRKEKNWARADQIRDELAAMGYEVKDTPQGPQIIKK